VGTGLRTPSIRLATLLLYRRSHTCYTFFSSLCRRPLTYTTTCTAAPSALPVSAARGRGGWTTLAHAAIIHSLAFRVTTTHHLPLPRHYYACRLPAHRKNRATSARYAGNSGRRRRPDLPTRNYNLRDMGVTAGFAGRTTPRRASSRYRAALNALLHRTALRGSYATLPTADAVDIPTRWRRQPLLRSGRLERCWATSLRALGGTSSERR